MADTLLRFRDDTASTAPVVAFADLSDTTNAAAVRLLPGEDARALLPLLDRLELVEIAFPAYTDGRGYSAARILREAGYKGELRAAGDVLVDQLAYMRRCGFDSFAPEHPLNAADAEAAMARYAEVYQPTVDGRAPVWAKRHG